MSSCYIVSFCLHVRSACAGILGLVGYYVARFGFWMGEPLIWLDLRRQDNELTR